MKIDMELCFRCGACSCVCPKNSVEVTEFDIRVSEACNDCGICEGICPVGAITFDRKGKSCKE